MCCDRRCRAYIRLGALVPASTRPCHDPPLLSTVFLALHAFIDALIAQAGKKIINESGLAITSADDLDDAAQKAVAAMKAAAA